MSKEIKNTVVPKLRFPEFMKSNGWELLSIGTKVESISGYPFTSSEISGDKSGIPLMRGINITEGYIRHSTDIDRYFVGNVESLEKYKLHANDLVIGMDGSKVGKNSALITEGDSGSLLIQRVARLRAAEKGMIQFIFQLIKSTKFYSYVDRINTSGGIPHISLKQIKDFQIFFPPIKDEQQKIADCLSSLDELMTAETQKLEALKAHKKGLIQHLFPAEGETVPELRFKEFRDSGEWELKKLEEVAKIGRGKSKHRPRDATFLFGGNYPFIQTGDIRKAGLYLVDYSQTYSEEGLKQSKLWDKNTLCITIAANIAETAILKIKACFPDSIIGLIPKADRSNVLFVKYLFDNFKIQIQRQSQGVAQDNLNQEKLSNIEFIFPSLNEQQKIADCLFSLDELISAQTEKIQALRNHKKGLMQQLFPVSEL